MASESIKRNFTSSFRHLKSSLWLSSTGAARRNRCPDIGLKLSVSERDHRQLHLLVAVAVIPAHFLFAD